MNLVMCSIRDSKAEAWMTPLFFQSRGQAIRSFGDAVNDPQTEFAKHPEDYVLFVVGEFDPSAGVVVSIMCSESLALGGNLVRGVE